MPQRPSQNTTLSRVVSYDGSQIYSQEESEAMETSSTFSTQTLASGFVPLDIEAEHPEITMSNFLKAKDIDQMHRLRRLLSKDSLRDSKCQQLLQEAIDRGFVAAEIRGLKSMPEPEDDEFYPIQALCNVLLNPFVIDDEHLRSRVMKKALALEPSPHVDTPNYALRLCACIGAQTKFIDPKLKFLIRNVIECEKSDSLLSNRASVSYAAVYLKKDEDLEDVCSLLFHPQYLVRQNIKAWIFKQLYEDIKKSDEEWSQVVTTLSKYIDNAKSVKLTSVKEDFLKDLAQYRQEKLTIGYSKKNQYQMLNLPNIMDLPKMEAWKQAVKNQFEKLTSDKLVPVSVIVSQFHAPKDVVELYDLDGDGKLSETELVQLSYLMSSTHK
ncbi:hypothetical protein C9374_008087 [Naegleria lovaniensis]|uniref:EF-hand domain-containing protein n=1 Tax=Naegleria lovaniensis TaxID=51637 RepID=A0AA88KI28_NAELO|nr:uncharacterized protein C9374_008087 [Naegleria lovaniensis]KAG2378448.1 hypothetical protein C9374_008087 [Naegleria lovaniensis]